MEYKVIKILDRYFYKDEEGRLYGDKDGRGFLYAGQFRMDDLAVVKREDGNYYYIDEMFREAFGPFDRANDFCYGIASVQKDNVWYFFDIYGEVIAGPYKEAFDFHEGLAPVKREDEKWYYFSNMGEEELGPYDFADKFSGRLTVLAVIRKKDKFYFINREGQEVLGPFKHAFSFEEEVAVVQKEEDEKWYAIDTTGKILSKPYEKAGCFWGKSYLVDEDEDGWRKIRVDKNGEESDISFHESPLPRLSQEEIAALEEDTLKRLAEGRKRLAELEAEEAERKE